MDMNKQILVIAGAYMLGILIFDLMTRKKPIEVIADMVHPLILGLLLSFRVSS